MSQLRPLIRTQHPSSLQQHQFYFDCHVQYYSLYRSYISAQRTQLGRLAARSYASKGYKRAVERLPYR